MTKRKPDPLWDVAVELCDGGGRGPITKLERGKWNKGLKELRDAGATPEQLRAAIGVYKRKNKGCACNPLAIAGQWGRLLGETQGTLAQQSAQKHADARHAAEGQRWAKLEAMGEARVWEAVKAIQPVIEKRHGKHHWVPRTLYQAHSEPWLTAILAWDKEQA